MVKLRGDAALPSLTRPVPHPPLAKLIKGKERLLRRKQPRYKGGIASPPYNGERGKSRFFRPPALRGGNSFFPSLSLTPEKKKVAATLSLAQQGTKK